MENLMNTFTFKVNNGQVMELSQCGIDHDIILEGVNPLYIPSGDMVMLINLYKYIRDNDIQNEFINPYGKNTDER